MKRIYLAILRDPEAILQRDATFGKKFKRQPANSCAAKVFAASIKN